MTGNSITIYKKRGETPLLCLERLREECPKFKEALLSYAGRLDPMAEGVLLVLVGDENNNREQYLGLDKEYTFDVLFGFSTDTYDVLGKLTHAATKATHKRVATKAILFCGKTEQAYPPYSSKPVKGKPMFLWAREGKLDKIEIPERDIEIFDSALAGMRTIRAEDLWNQIDSDIALIQGDFRQKEIRDCWWEHIRPLYGEVFDVATIHIRCSSGTYVRALAQHLGEQVCIPALALKIVRTRVGEYTVRQE